jgi:peptide/nickel transport system ATP-binding protein
MTTPTAPATPAAEPAARLTDGQPGLLELEGLKVYFPIKSGLILDRHVGDLQAVDGVDLAVQRGETLGLVGESGCGKSTLARAVIRLYEPTAGRIVFDGEDIGALSGESLRRIRSRMQMIFQDPYASLNPRWRVADIIAEPIRAFGLAKSRGEVESKVGELLRLVGLDPSDGAKYPHEFSGGQRQRIAIARALSSNPEFIICDEPTSALDVSVQAQILNLMRDLQDEFGLTYLFISHNLAVVRHMASRIGVMYLGKLVEVSPSHALFNDARHPYTRMLLDAVPDVDMTGRERAQVKGEVPNPVDPPTGCTFHPRCPHAFERCPVEEPGMTRIVHVDHGPEELQERHRQVGDVGALPRAEQLGVAAGLDHVRVPADRKVGDVVDPQVR